MATRLGQALGWYRPGEGAGLIGAIVGALIVLFIWHMVAGHRATDTTYRQARRLLSGAAGPALRPASGKLTRA